MNLSLHFLPPFQLGRGVTDLLSSQGQPTTVLENRKQHETRMKLEFQVIERSTQDLEGNSISKASSTVPAIPENQDDLHNSIRNTMLFLTGI